MTTLPFESTLRLRSAPDLLAAVPYLIGHHPTDSLVAVGLRGSKLHFHLRAGLLAPGATDEAVRRWSAHFIAALAPQGCDGYLLVGYGRPDRVAPAVQAVLDTGRLEVYQAYRASGDRFWSLCPGGPALHETPEEGEPYDAGASPVAAAATVAGLVALPDRASVVAVYAAPEGERLAAAQAATARACDRLGILVTRGDRHAGTDVVRAGRLAIAQARARYAEGGRLTDDEVGWLVVLLVILRVRDNAWHRIDHTDRAGWWAWERLWTDVLTRCDPDFAAPPGALLSYTLWLRGDGLRAGIAVERSLAADAKYLAALLMADVLTRAVTPSSIRRLVDPGRSTASPRRRARVRAARRRRR